MPWLRHIPDGLDVKVDNEVYVVEGEWTVVITIDEPRPPAELLNFVHGLLALPQFRGRTTSINSWVPNWKTRLRRVLTECSEPRRWWRTQNSRQRRGLLDIVGQGMSFLFGTATDADLDDVRRLVSKLATNQSRIFNQLAQYTTVINHTYDEIQMNRDQINQIASRMATLMQDVDKRIRGLELQAQTLDKRFEMEVLLSRLEDISHRYVRAHEAWIRRKENLEAGRLTESILPPSVLESILTSEQQGGLIRPIQWYYEHTTIIPIWTDEHLVYKTRLPVVMPTRWHYVELQRWPMPLKEFQGQLLLPDAVLRNTETGDLDISPRCYGIRPRVCRQGLINQADIHPCLTRLLAEVPTYDPQCVVLFEKRLPLDTVHPMEYDKYVLVTDGTELALRCAGDTEQSTTVKAGVFEITLTYPCSLHGKTWKLLPTFQRSLNVTLSPEDIHVHVNVTIADLFEECYEHDPLAFGLSEMEAVDRKQINVSSLVQPVDFYFPKVWKKKLWHGFWLLLGGVLVAGLVYGRAHRRRARPSKSPIEIQLKPTSAITTETTSPTVQQAAPPSLHTQTDMSVFTFTGNQDELLTDRHSC